MKKVRDYEKVKIVKENNKLRVIAKDGNHVRFPRDKRIEGAIYAVEELSAGNNCWIAKGHIERIK